MTPGWPSVIQTILKVKVVVVLPSTLGGQVYTRSLVHRWARAAALAGAHGFEGHTPVCLLLEGLGISTNFKKGNLTISVENLFELLYDLVILLLVNGDVSPYESPKLYVLVESFEISRFVHLWHIKGAIAYSLIKWSGVDLGVVGSETYGIWTPS